MPGNIDEYGHPGNLIMCKMLFKMLVVIVTAVMLFALICNNGISSLILMKEQL